MTADNERGKLARFSQAHPGVDVGLREGIAADMLRLLAADELDAAFCLLAGEIPGAFTAERLTGEEVVAHKPLRLALESGDPFLLRVLAARGFATAILPRSLTALEGPAVELRSLHSAAHLPVALVWRGERNLSPAARACIEFVRRETTDRDRRPTTDDRRPPRILGLWVEAREPGGGRQPRDAARPSHGAARCGLRHMKTLTSRIHTLSSRTAMPAMTWIASEP